MDKQETLEILHNSDQELDAYLVAYTQPNAQRYWDKVKGLENREYR